MHILDAVNPADHHRNNPEYLHIDVPVAVYNKFANNDELQAHLAPRIAALVAAQSPA